MYLIVGRIVRPHGIHGEVIVDVRTDEPESRFTVGASLVTSTDPNAVPDDSVRSGAPAGSDGSVHGGSAHAGSVHAGSAAGVSTGNSVGAARAGSPEAGDESPGEVRWTVPPALTIEALRAHQGRLIVSFQDVYDRNLAEELRGVFLWVDATGIAPPEDPDEFHDHQLVGLTAVNPEGETLGEVTRIEHAPASDLLVLRRTTGGTTLVPFVREIVPEVDIAGRRVVIDPPEGLLDL